MNCVASWWSRSVPCRGTIGERFLRDYGVDVMPAASIRFLRCAGFVDGSIATPAVVLPFRRWPEPRPLVLEAWPLAIDGRAAVRLEVELWADPEPDASGVAFQVGALESDLVLTVSGLDALVVTCRHGVSCWGVPNWNSLKHVMLPSVPKARRLTVITSDPPHPETVRRWRLEGREVGWIAPHRFWGGMAA